MQEVHFHAPAAAGGLKRLHHALALAALLSASLIAAPAWAGAAAGSQPDAKPADRALAASVQAALLNDRLFQEPGVDIAVRAHGGKVELSGWVANVTDDAVARRIAGSVGGVESVTAQFRAWSSESTARVPGASVQGLGQAPRLTGATPADLALAGAVRAALLKHPVFQAAQVDLAVLASNDSVKLSGWAGDVADDALARRIAASVPGVGTVTSNLRAWSTEGESRVGTAGAARGAAGAPVEAAAGISGVSEADRALAGQVRAAVLQGPAFQDAGVDVAVRAEQGKVSLSGWVGYADDALRARQLAATVPGVKTVTSHFKSWSSETGTRL